VSSRKRYARKNRAFRRQGEWFFVPAPSAAVNEKLICRNEPLSRGRGKPHLVEPTLPHGRRVGLLCTTHPAAFPNRNTSVASFESNAARWHWSRMVVTRASMPAARASQRPRHHHAAVLAPGFLMTPKTRVAQWSTWRSWTETNTAVAFHLMPRHCGHTQNPHEIRPSVLTKSPATVCRSEASRINRAPGTPGAESENENPVPPVKTIPNHPLRLRRMYFWLMSRP